MSIIWKLMPIPAKFLKRQTNWWCDNADVVAALIWDKDRFLICQRPETKARGLLWEFVGGGAWETKEQALVRECREELAVTVAIGSVFTDATMNTRIRPFF